jgi:hypothetical protein
MNMQSPLEDEVLVAAMKACVQAVDAQNEYQNAHGDDICAASSGGQTEFAEKNSVKIGGELRALLCS